MVSYRDTRAQAEGDPHQLDLNHGAVSDFPGVQGVKTPPPHAGGLGSIPSQGTKTHTSQLKILHDAAKTLKIPSQIKKKKLKQEKDTVKRVKRQPTEVGENLLQIISLYAKCVEHIEAEEIKSFYNATMKTHSPV